MTLVSRRQWVAAAILALGVVALVMAPRAQWCVTSGDATACETIATIVLNVLGVVLLASGLIAFAIATSRRRMG